MSDKPCEHGGPTRSYAQPAPLWSSSNSDRVVLVVDAGSVKAKPDYVDLIELEPGARSPIVVSAGF